jgi:hypothetical protein
LEFLGAILSPGANVRRLSSWGMSPMHIVIRIE